MRPTTMALTLAVTILGAPIAFGQSQTTTPSQPVTTAPVAGSNSFTEGQARSRIEAAGFSNVTGLTKDDHGVWRGQASRNGASTAVGLDYQGNVIEGSAPATR
jgi:hypothetical protein